jgi:hypothetical protein
MFRQAFWRRLSTLLFLAAAPPASGELTAIDVPPNTTPGPPINLAWPLFAPELSRGPRHIQVGPARAFKLPSQAAQIALAGDIIEIDAETYVGDVAIWNADNLTIRGTGGRARLLAAGKSAEGKAIWVIKGRNAIVQDIEFAGASVPAGNGAGIRQEGANLTILNCFFHDNQEGILSSIYMLDSKIDIENSEFARDGGNGGQSHEIYISNIRQLTVRGSYFHEGRIGHLIKSRAQRNFIIANRVTDEANGAASYEIEFPNGGFNVVAGNLIEQGPGAQNSSILANALEGASNTIQELYVVNNTFVNDLGRGNFVFIRPPSRATLINNIFVGGGNVLIGLGRLKDNLLAAGVGGAPTVEQPLFLKADIIDVGTRTAHDAGLRDVKNFDYRLRPDSYAIGGGVDPGAIDGIGLLPAFAYAHPAQARPIKTPMPIDIGAYQHGD